ncbi:hypothetical protein AAFF_G00130930 [Aldrovandia affinis]|uniref:Uncharacterized protein n=1 Tax=Aldrovandia affinis TaxID=143900 RepID=A0AAD7RQV4_9TELE|nr:hypothetical protein AAFF_G00130930 [Aldrovandia affinis]
MVSGLFSGELLLDGLLEWICVSASCLHRVGQRIQCSPPAPSNATAEWRRIGYQEDNRWVKSTIRTCAQNSDPLLPTVTCRDDIIACFPAGSHTWASHGTGGVGDHNISAYRKSWTRSFQAVGPRFRPTLASPPESLPSIDCAVS